MNKSDSAEKTSKSECVDKPSISVSLAKLLDAAIETYFQPLEKPLPGWMRFFCAWLGSITIYLAPVFYKLGPREWGIVEIPFAWLVVILSVVLPSMIGFLIAYAKTCHGPVRLYLSGMILSVFSIGIVYGLWAP